MHSKINANYNTTLSPAAPVGGIVAMGVAGAVVTGSIAAAGEIRKAKAGDEDRSQAVANVAKEAFGGGLAVAAGAAVGRTLFRSGFAGALAMVAVSVGVKYAYDGLTAKKEAAPAEHHKGSKK